MDLELSADQRALLDVSRSFLEQSAPASDVRRMALERQELDPAYWKQGAELGWTSMFVPERLGGGSLTGRPLVDLAIVAEELGRWAAPGPIIGCNVVASALSRSGSPAHEAILAEIATGGVVAAWAFAEQPGTWEPGGLATRAEDRGGDVLLTGTKSCVEAAETASVFLVTARSDRGLAQFTVDRRAPGVEVTAMDSLDPSRRFGLVHLDGVVVPADARVGDTATADADIADQLALALALQCAETVGCMTRAFDMTMAWAQDRVAFGRTIGSYQALKHRLAYHKLWLEADLAASGALSRAAASGDRDAWVLASAAKAHIGDTAMTLIQDCIQIHGGIGLTWEHDLHLFLRRATVNRVLYGSPAQHRERLCQLLSV
jgi:alkylation response protein AidB-like acyl-CoA dehydrogenase